jgi:FimV-like protein
MIYLIIKSYLIIFFLVIAGVMSIFIGGLYLIFKFLKPRKKKKRMLRPVTVSSPKIKNSGIHVITSNDINAIAGDDVLATQLDLARAYIETGKAQLAKKILEYVVAKGTASQKQEARHLLGYT